MAIHKLANGPLTMTVASITPMQGNFGPQFKLTGADGTDVGSRSSLMDAHCAATRPPARADGR